jgi:tetratricopeptide (TPR) repeat protein
MSQKVIISFFFLLLVLVSKSANRDSLIKVLEKHNALDSTRVKILKLLTYSYLLDDGNVDEALKTCAEGIEVAQKSNSILWLGKMHSINAYIKSNYSSDYKGSIDSYFTAIKCFESINDLSDLLTAYLNLGFTFYQYKEYNDADTYFKKAEKIALILKSDEDLGNIYINLGGVNESLNNDSIATNYYLKAKTYYSKTNAELELAMIDLNMANLRIKDKNHVSISTRKEVIEVFNRVKDVFKRNDAENYYLISIISLGTELTKVGELIKAYSYLREAEKIAIEIKDYRNLINVYDRLSTNAKLRGDKDDELEALKSYIIYNDSLFEENKSKAITELQTKYETDKKEKENLVLTLENKNKSQIIYFALGGCLLLFGLVFFIYRGYRTKQKANCLLEEKNEIINHQKTIVEEQHQDITDSIKYAQRIQGAILPPKNMW